ncbi:MAG: hypothetical protein SGILL_007958, partial [Bacillariaceae sp.]
AAVAECSKWTTAMTTTTTKDGRESMATPMMVVVGSGDDEDDDETETDSSDDSEGAVDTSSAQPCFGNLFDWFPKKETKQTDPTTLKAMHLQKRLGKIVNKLSKMDHRDDDGRINMDEEKREMIDSELTDIQESLVTMENYLKMIRLQRQSGSLSLNCDV